MSKKSDELVKTKRKRVDEFLVSQMLYEKYTTWCNERGTLTMSVEAFAKENPELNMSGAKLRKSFKHYAVIKILNIKPDTLDKSHCEEIFNAILLKRKQISANEYLMYSDKERINMAKEAVEKIINGGTKLELRVKAKQIFNEYTGSDLPVFGEIYEGKVILNGKFTREDYSRFETILERGNNVVSMELKRIGE